MYAIILMGLPCAGKTTTGKIMTTIDPSLIYISSGDIARNMAKYDKNCCASLIRGELAPEDQMRDMVADCINGMINKDENFILDGFPRFMDQDIWLEANFGDRVDFKYVLVYTSDIEIYSRAKMRKRIDDNLIKKRIEHYYGKTWPIIEKHRAEEAGVISYNGESITVNNVRELLKRVVK
jgi:adenylate kinase family enzyme